jgi:hypothetical protein
VTPDVTDAEVYESYEYRQYALILDDFAAFYYAREELIAARARELTAPAPELPSYQEWYRQYLQSDDWRRRADAAKARFGGRCALCNAIANLQAHHRTYERVGHEAPDDLTALCDDCHSAYHRWRASPPPP